MKKLQKLNEKKVENLENVKGGLMQMMMEFSDGDKTTSNSASWNGRHWVTDTKEDAGN